MSTNLIINQATDLKNDNTYNNCQFSSNEKLFQHFLDIPIPETNNSGRNGYIQSTKNVGILQNKNVDVYGRDIDDSTLIRNGNIQNNISKKELDTRLFPGAPLLSSGQSVLKNPDLSSRLKFGEETRVSKSVNLASSYSADNFIPLVPSIQANVQNVDHIIPTYWVRGGMSTRTVVRNIDYLKSSGETRYM
jgi:hypothetical protein